MKTLYVQQSGSSNLTCSSNSELLHTSITLFPMWSFCLLFFHIYLLFFINIHSFDVQLYLFFSSTVKKAVQQKKAKREIIFIFMFEWTAEIYLQLRFHCFDSDSDQNQNKILCKLNKKKLIICLMAKEYFLFLP